MDNYLLYAQLELIATDERRISELRHEVALGTVSVIEQSASQVAQRYQRLEMLQLTIEDNPVFAINELYLKKIVDELVDNAFKFSPRHGFVRVYVTANETYGTIQVSDQGIGLTEEQIKQIGAYMQFSRRLREQQGTGWDWRSSCVCVNCTAVRCPSRVSQAGIP